MAVQSDENKRSPLKAWVRALERTAPIERNPHLTLPALIGRLAERYADAPALISPETTLSYRALGEATGAAAESAIREALAYLHQRSKAA